MHNLTDRIPTPLFPPPLVQLTYVSTRAPRVTDDDVVDLAIKSNVANRSSGIKGCLWFGSKRFFQVLEGEQERIDRLYRKIKLDPRHVGVRLLSYSSLDVPHFARWSLAHVSHREDETIERLIVEYTGGEPRAPAEQQRSGTLQRIVERLRDIVGQRPDSIA